MDNTKILDTVENITMHKEKTIYLKTLGKISKVDTLKTLGKTRKVVELENMI